MSSSKPNVSGIVNPYLKKPIVATAAAVVSSFSSSSSSVSSSSISSSASASNGRSTATNPYQQQNDSSASSSSGSKRAPTSVIDLTSSPESSPIKKRSKNIAAASAESSSSAASSNNAKYKIFCDLDGVLVDFDSGIQRAMGRRPEDIPSNILWAKVSSIPSFYERLPWMADGKELWNAIQHLDPDILTGVPMAKKARAEKAAWCRRELGVPTNHVDMAGKKKAHEVVSGRKRTGVVNIITCWSRNKHCEGGPQTVLIDDRESLQADWVAKGGIFILHTKTAKTLSELRRLGILS